MPKEAFKAFIKDQNLEDHPLLLMVSGGVDSMTLLQIASGCHPAQHIHVLHINHQTRKSNTDDEHVVQNFCSKLNINCTVHTLEKPKESKNLESHWRRERQKISADLAKKLGGARILTAHHATDLVETMIFRLTKGCGPGGLSPFDTSVKPFWHIPKATIIEYATKHNIPWNEDPTNDEVCYQRNLIRNQVLPELRKITPNLEKVFVHESIIFGEVDDYIKTQTNQDQKIELSSFLGLPKALQRAKLRSICPKTPSFDEMEDFFKWIENNPQGGSQKDLGSLTIKLESAHLVW